jgi:chorismate mutase
MNMVRGIRGAIRAAANTKEAIFEATTELLHEVLEKNGLSEEDIISMFLTTTPDLNADFPAYAVRTNGLTTVPVLCAREIDVPGAMGRLIRMLLHVETERPRGDIQHVYLGEAAKLRPDRVHDSSEVE